MHFDLTAALSKGDRIRVILICALLAVAIAIVDRTSRGTFSMGMLYIVPLVICAVLLPRWQVIVLSVIAAILAEHFRESAWNAGAIARLTFTMIAFGGSSLCMAEMVRSRRLEAGSLRKLAQEVELRREAETYARRVLESSPAAIITVNPDGHIDLTNEAARQMLGLTVPQVAPALIGKYFPVLEEILHRGNSAPLIRTMVEASGRRGDGQMFFAQMWLSTYSTAGGTKLVAVIADASEQLRDREELGLRQLLMNSRIIAAAVSHEIRNLAAAGEVLHANLAKMDAVRDSEDYQSLGRVIDALRKLSASEVPSSAEQVLTGVDLNALFRELAIILAPESDVEFRWEIAQELPRVRADHSGLLQVFLNLTLNSRRALSGRRDALVKIIAYQLGQSVVIRLEDNGPGVSSPELLFKPFQPGASSSGLGLYVSRALIRTYGGELQYVRRANEACFVIELPSLIWAEAHAGD